MSTKQTEVGAHRVEEGLASWDNAASNMGELWELVKDSELGRAYVVEEDGSFANEARAWWSSGQHALDYRQVSSLLFEAPDVLVKHIQSRYAGELARRFFGNRGDVALEDIVVENDNRDRNRTGFRRDLNAQAAHTEVRYGEDLQRAICITASSDGNSFISLKSAVGQYITQARVRSGNLELRVPELLRETAQDSYKRVLQSVIQPMPRFIDD